MKDKELLKIRFSDKDPVMAKKFVNALTLNFINENLRLQKEEAGNAIEFISQELKIYGKKLENSQKNFSINKIYSDLRVAGNRKMLLEERLSKLQKFVPSKITKEKNPVIVQLSAQLGGFESELALQMIDSKGNNPRVIELKKIIRELKRKIDEERNNETVKESITIINPEYLLVDQELKQLEMEMLYLEKRKKELDTGAVKIKKPVSDEELTALERDKKVDEDIYQMLLKNLETAYVSKRLQDSEKGNRFSVIEYARLPIQPLSSNKFKVIFLGMFAGGCLGLGLVFLLEYLDKSFLTAEDAKKFLPVSVLGTISNMVEKSKSKNHLKEYIIKYLHKNKMFSIIEFIDSFRLRPVAGSKISPQVIMHHEPQSRIAEEYRVLKTNITGYEAEKAQKCFMITSTAWGEGKTTTAVNLAIAFSQSGKKTLLVDGDIRKGSVNALFSMEQTPGLTDVISGDIDLKTAVIKSSIRNLSVLPRGSMVINPSELLESDVVAEVIGKLKNLHDVIIIDSPPVINLADPSILGRYADQTLMVIQMERTQREDVLNVYNDLLKSSVNIKGFILTKARYYMPRYLYNYYYGKAYNGQYI